MFSTPWVIAMATAAATGSGSTTHVLDRYYLAITALVTVGFQLLFFTAAFVLRTDKFTDVAGGANFAVLAVLTLALRDRDTARPIVASLLLIVWALRLAGFLLFRILKTGSDDRFDDKRDRFLPLLGFWTAQMVWVWTVSLPVTVLNSPAVAAYPQYDFGTGRDIAGLVLYTIGFVFEAASDVQRYRFRKTRANEGAVCDVGFFAVSRHPNYFGEIIIHFAIWIMAVSPAADGFVGGQARKALYATILGPFFITFLLLFVSGLPLSERPKAKQRYEKGNNWEGYKRWLDRTSVLIPFPPQLYEKMPVLLKRTLFLEFPLYVFDPAKHSDAPESGGRAAEEGDSQGSS